MELIPGVEATEDKEIIEQIAYQTAQYFPLGSKEYSNCKDLKGILKAAMNDSKVLNSPDGPGYIASLQSIIGPGGTYTELGNAKIENQSWLTDYNDEDVDTTGFQACTFNLDGKISVCYRGTPGGSWLDNGYAMAGVEKEIDGDVKFGEYKDTGVEVSQMQKEALDYMEYLTNLKAYKDTEFYLSGHSKGGNETQLAALMFPDNVAAAYNFDGQGFPPEVVKQLQNLPGWEEGLKKIYGIHADNDYVHGLGNTITLGENTVFLYTPEIGVIPYPMSDDQSLIQNHFITAMLTPDGRLQRQTMEGPLALGVKSISDIIMSIEDEDVRYAVCMAVMSKLQDEMGVDEKGNPIPPVGGEDTAKVFEDAMAVIKAEIEGKYGEQIKQILATLTFMADTEAGRRALGATAMALIAMGLSSELGQFIISGGSELDKMLAEHDFENAEQIAAYLKEHSQIGKLEYLVRGALLHCRYGTHARQLNLRKDHGIYINGHPCMHALNCVTGQGEKDNITFFGICNAPHPPATGVIDYPKDAPRDPKTGAKLAKASGGTVTGCKCQPIIVGSAWLDTYDGALMVDNGDLDPIDREKVNGRALPPEAITWTKKAIVEYRTAKGLPTITNLSFLLCNCGGLIEPYNSGQQYKEDPAGP